MKYFACDFYESDYMRNTNAFRTRAKDEIVKLEKDVYGRDVSHEEIEIVFLTYIMGYIKGLFVVAKNTQGRIYEISSNPSTNKFYIDVYTKEGNKVVDL
jgi:hypothetical protein